MACDTSLLDGLFDDMEDEEDWTSTDWAGEVPATAHSDYMGTKSIAQDAKSRLVSFACKKPERSAEPLEQTQGGPVVQRMLLNDNKAGMEGLDKDRINQIIHEASKGSKFYENERLKEEQMKKRIEEQKTKIQEISAEQLRQGTIEADRLLEDFEQQRDLSRTVVHIDMDAFYAAVEMRDNPSLKTKPMAVGGNSMLSTSNYHARKFGVRAAMPGFIGKKLCPELIIVPLNFEKYTAVSKQVRAIMSEYDPNFCPMSLDEAYLDLTEHLQNRQGMSEDERTYICRDPKYADSRAHCKCDLTEIARNYGNNTVIEDGSNLNEYFSKNHHFEAVLDNGSSDRIDRNVVICPVCKKVLPPFKRVTFGLSDEDAVNEMRSRIEQKTTLTASAGIAPNMMLAKVCSDKNKPNGQYKIQSTREDVMDFIRDLPTRKISGIGKVSEAMLNAVGVYTCTDLYEKRGLLYHLYSPISFNYFMRICLGIGSTTVERDSERKSMSTERTFSELSKPADLYQKCEELCESLAEDLKSEQLKGKTVSIKIKTVKFEVRTRAHTLKDYTNEYEDILRSATELLRTEIQNCAPQPLRLRLMGVRMSNLLHESHCQGKKQNTIIGAFKRLKEISSENGSKSELGGSGTSDVNDNDTEVLKSITVGEIDVSVTEVKPAINKITGWKSAPDGLEEGFTNKIVTSTKIQHQLSVEPELENNEMPEKSEMILDNEKRFSKTKEKIGNEEEVNQNMPEKSDLEFESKEKVCDVGSKEDFKKVKGNADVMEHPNTCDKRPKHDIVYDTIVETEVDINAGNRASENSVTFADGDNIYVKVKEVNDASGNAVFKEEDNAHICSENPNSLDKENSFIFSPSLRKTRSGLIRTLVSQSRRKNKGVRNKQKAEGSAVTYTCPVCALNILCESLQTFNEHVDMCLESGERHNLGSTSTAKSNDEAQSDIKNEMHNSCDSTLGVIVTDEMYIGKEETFVNYESTVTGETSFNCDENLGGEESKLAENEEGYSKEQNIENVKISGKIERSSPEDTCTCCENESQPVLCADLKKGNFSDVNTENMRSDSNNSEIPMSEMHFKRITNTDIDIKCDTQEPNKPDLEDTGGCNKDVKVETETEPKLKETEALIRHIDALEVRKIDTEKSFNSENSDEVSENKVKYKVEINGSSCIESEVMEYGDKYKENEIGHRTEPELPQLPEIRDLSDTEDSSESNDRYLPQVPLSPNIIIKNCTERQKNTVSRFNLDQVDKRGLLGKEMDYPVHTTVGKELLKSTHVRQNYRDYSDEIEELNEEDPADDIKGVDDDEADGALLVCPVCNVEQRSSDLNEFNSHVDACLSRGTISQILNEQKKQENGGTKRSRALTPGSSKSVKRRKTTMPGSSKPCRSIASFFMEK